MCQHSRYRGAIRANEAKAEVGCRREYELPPSSTNVCERVPPAFTAPFPTQEDPSIVIGFVVIEENWSTMVKHIEK
jgi:hypothetical protein